MRREPQFRENVANCTCVWFFWGLISSLQPGTDATATEQRASRARQNWTDMMRSTTKSTQQDRMDETGLPSALQNYCDRRGPDINMRDGKRLGGGICMGLCNFDSRPDQRWQVSCLCLFFCLGKTYLTSLVLKTESVTVCWVILFHNPLQCL